MTSAQDQRTDRRTDAIVVGAGPAGLATSRHLSALGIDHVVLERDVVGSSWRTQRWDSFTLVTPTWSVRLPGLDLGGFDQDAFLPRDATADLFDSYAKSISAPVRTGVEVGKLRRQDDGYVLSTTEGDWHARAVVIASGGLRRPHIPDVAELPVGVTALHAVDYRRPEQLPAGAVLVVGGGQSGTQLAEELRRAGRKVYLSTSMVGRVPRRYRGRDIFQWLTVTGNLNQPTEQTPPMMRNAPQTMVSGVNGGHTVALQQLARDGVILLGRLTGADGGRFTFADDLAGNIEFADTVAARIRAQIDKYIESQPGEFPPADTDAAEQSLDTVPNAPATLDAAAEGISTVLWCTGMLPDTSWLPDDMLEPTGVPKHEGGALEAPGLHVVGFPWLTHRGSGVLYGMADDAERAADRIKSYLTS
ncbi:NAD(P)-binding domain-containing protein [Actinoplanes sp. TBRC 11911]|uniref:flavin-containing monooxygenase n=1 Tax=Actinoplanes sp. TBRC 11911 TaxID=2729386 RepID=UPI00145E2BD1|nr:NAD(P)/FAD-dependent oxidoreductase [Actinoplanes sp. TBRC 11911]NMO49955.1 NAD(P)-binding domain-containing protein [Actinoplanes sp. TBRC 11911]